MTDPKTTKRRLKEVEAEKAELELELKRIELLKTQLQHGPTLDISEGTFRLDTGVYEGVLQLSAVIDRWARLNPGEGVKLHIFSPGGSVFHGLTLYDTLRTVSERGNAVTTVVRGFAGSMASVIFLAGDTRLIGAESLIHQHEASTYTGGTTSQIKDEAEFMKRLEEKITGIYTSRTRMTKQQFLSRIRKKEWYAGAQEALELGIATDVG